MQIQNIQPVILAGGTGTRLWPLSRKQRPKQFLPLVGKESMMQQTLGRLAGLPHLPPCVICNEQHRFLAAEQLQQSGIDNAQLILEPDAKNTAPAIALAALQAINQGDDPILLVLAADHVIQDETAFQHAITQAQELAEQDKLVTFGIVPDRPETGYGYIERGDAVGPGWHVSRFVEKPDADRAAEYYQSGRYYWNSGMFMFKARRYLNELEAARPDILAACRQAMDGAVHDMDFTRVDAEAFAICPADSVDYAVMENTQDAAMVALDAGWNDLGAWAALAEVQDCDAQHNYLQGDVLTEDTHGSLIHAESRLVAAVGVSDLVLVETKDAVLVAHKDEVQNVKEIVAQLQAAGRTEHIAHREVFRPWGSYDSIGTGHRYQVKTIRVKPGAKLSLQKHHHRAEHWVVVSGTAQVTNGDETYTITENQSTYIPIGQIHALENPGVIDLELIEVQSGAYLGEDDIVRLEDRYGRV